MDDEKLHDLRDKIQPVDDDIDEWYEEFYDELFFRAEQSVGAKIHPAGKDGGDE